MRLTSCISTALLSVTAVSAGRSLKHAGNSKRLEEVGARHVRSEEHQAHSQFMERQGSAPKFLNANTTSEWQVLPPFP